VLTKEELVFNKRRTGSCLERSKQECLTKEELVFNKRRTGSCFWCFNTRALVLSAQNESPLVSQESCSV
jgi:hypothetical protein